MREIAVFGGTAHQALAGQRLAGEAAAAFGGEVVLARDVDRIPVPARDHPAAG